MSSRYFWSISQTALTLIAVLCLQACGDLRIHGPGLDGDLNAGLDPTTLEVLDSSKVMFFDGSSTLVVHGTVGRMTSCGYGNVTGKPVSGSRFSKLDIGQSMQEVLALAGHPDAQHVGLIKKPGFGFNTPDVHEDYRLETSYVGVGRLVFGYLEPIGRQMAPGFPSVSATAKASCPGLRLKWVIHNRHEPTGPLEKEGAHLRAYDGPAPE